MFTRAFTASVLCLVMMTASPALAEIVASRGAAQAEISAVIGQQAQPPVTDTRSFPAPEATLPLQAAVRIIADDAAAVAGAQFADPNTATGPDTDQFALQIALVSADPNVGYRGLVGTEETRTLRFSAAELGNATPGAAVRLTGRLFLDGAIALFASTDAATIDDAEVVIRVIVERGAEGASTVEVFRGELTVRGRGTQAEIFATGAFPTLGVFATDLAIVDETLAVFEVVAFPALQIDYSYDAIADGEITLRARVEAEAKTPGDDVGVAAVMGTPITALTQVVTAVENGDLAAKMTGAMEAERDDPTGDPVFEDNLILGPFSFLRACGLFGVEMIALAAFLGAMRLRGIGRI